MMSDEMMEYMEAVENHVDVLDRFCARLRSMPKEVVQASICTMLDDYCYVNKIPLDKELELIDEIRKLVEQMNLTEGAIYNESN